ncbi:carbohydrate ABC transporter permease [Fictibacillus sp. KU28468]|uniref:carbohydrate ABC transporter permease n=1 Tax=Fictibacillus sp. KU28468 TaxID=2991053 RepID=UPI00223D621A|nr:carbohydrate ABC transporter permease [Fictibacillus sp. KU28468]UZJ78090.1 carbohydrate ABC transporter permease [Fictibacillus sp. KU28468]
MNSNQQAPKFYETQSFKRKSKKLLVVVLLLLGSIVILSPVWWMISTSLKTPAEIMQYPPSLLPESFQWGNYIKAWQTAPFTRWALNTLFITICVVIGNVFVNSFVAYGFAKIRFKGRNILFTLVLATMLIPGFVMMIPQYMLFSKLHWINTYLPLIVPAFFGNAFFIFLLRQFFKTIPDEMIDAAKIDGAHHLQIWWKLAMPLMKPAVITVAILSFNGAWNDFLGPLLYINDEKLYTLQIGLQTFKGTVQTQWHYLMSASVLVLLPVILLFFFFQRYFIEGSNITEGSKG